MRQPGSGLIAGATLVALGMLVACRAEPSVVSDPELRAELGIPDETPIHRIELSGVEARSRVIPRVSEASPGDIVQFVVMDHRAHLVRFLDDELSPAALAFLRRTSQDSPPPMVERGARLVLTFDGAPEGIYVFVAEGNGTPARGEIRVTTSGLETRRDP